jgi:putative transposase
VVEEFTRECLAIEVGASFVSRRVITVLERAFAEQGPPDWLRSDNEPEFIAEVLNCCFAERGPIRRYIGPGCPWQSHHGESFCGRLRDECLDRELFANRREAAAVLAAWRQKYDGERPDSSLGYRTPREFRTARMRSSIPEPGGTEGSRTHGP